MFQKPPQSHILTVGTITTMKNITVLILILICFELKGQSYNELIGSAYSHKSEIAAFDTLIGHGAGVIPTSRLILRQFIDSSYTTRYVILEQEKTVSDTSRTFTILDLIQFENIGDSSTVIVGTYDITTLDKDTLRNGFIIAYECCHDLSNAQWQDTPKTPIKAWYTGDNSKKLIEINPEKVLRKYAYVIFKEN